MKNKLYGFLWRRLVKAWTNGKFWRAEIKGLGDVKSMAVLNGDLVIIVDGQEKLGPYATAEDLQKPAINLQEDINNRAKEER